jgi:hypothetical protein
MNRMFLRHVLRTPLLAAGIVCLAASAHAQNWSGDARRIAMGGVGSSENLASSMIREERGYRTIVIPLGLFQVLKDFDIFDPGSDEFDIVRSVEYAAAPLHYTIDRDGTGSGVEFMNAIRNAELSRDLNDYRGFVPVTQPVAYGLGNPVFGGTIPVYRSDTTRHGIFVGAGPYFGFRGDLAVDDELVGILGSDVDVYIPNTAFPVTSSVRAELALAIVGGYRGKFALPAGGSGDEREGIYVALNYNHLRGFRYEDADIAVRLDTDPQGLLTVNPVLPPPVLLGRQSSEDGRGFAIDLGVAAFLRQWELGFGVNGLANRIDWTGVEGTAYSIGDVFNGGDFVESPTVPLPDARIKQPVEYTGNVGYHADRWTAIGQVAQRTTDDPRDEDRFNGTTFRTGFEYRFGILEPRVGAYYTRERWNPAAGLGLNFGGFGIDAAMFTTDANVQRERHTAFALSLRIGRRGPRS